MDIFRVSKISNRVSKRHQESRTPLSGSDYRGNILTLLTNENFLWTRVCTI